MSQPDLSNIPTRNLGRRFEENARADYFCQWCYDRGLRYPDNGKPWAHAKDCPNRLSTKGGDEPCPPNAQAAGVSTNSENPVAGCNAEATSNPLPSALPTDGKPEAKPCPFCGNADCELQDEYDVIGIYAAGWANVYCGSCQCHGPTVAVDARDKITPEAMKEKALHDWNRRTPDPHE